MFYPLAYIALISPQNLNVLYVWNELMPLGENLFAAKEICLQRSGGCFKKGKKARIQFHSFYVVFWANIIPIPNLMRIGWKSQS